MIDLYVFTAKPGLPYDPLSIYLESFLNASQIPFQTYHSDDFSSKLHLPYIRENHVNISETGFIINYLEEKVEFDFDGHLDELMKATHFAFEQLLLTQFSDLLAMAFWLDDHNVNQIKSILNKETPPPLVALKIRKIQKAISQRLNLRADWQLEFKHRLIQGKKTLSHLSELLSERQWFGGLYLSKLDLIVYACLKSLLLDDFKGELHDALKTHPNLIYHNKRVSLLFSELADASSIK
jgi:glutathione S-transferase